MTELRLYEDREAMAEEAAAGIAARLSDAVAARGRATLSLCGGSTPGPVYRALAQTGAPWDRIIVTLSDDRWTPPDSEYSNERLARETLLTGNAAAAKFTGLYTGADSAKDAVAEVERKLEAAPRPIDVGILGLGEDGHTASLFPGGPEAAFDADTEARAAAVERDGPGPVTEGVTMTLAELAAHRALVFLATGPAKRMLIEAAIGGGVADSDGLPVARVIAAARGDVDIYWAP